MAVGSGGCLACFNREKRLVQTQGLSLLLKTVEMGLNKCNYDEAAVSDRVGKGLQWGYFLAMGQIKLNFKGMGRRLRMQEENSYQSLNLVQGLVSTTQSIAMYMFRA